MEFRDALARTAYYKAVSWVGALVWLGLVAAGYYVTLGGLPANQGVAVSNATSPAVLALGVLGFVVWQLAATAAFYRSLIGAVDTALADRFDPEVVKSDILSVLDERLADMQTQLEGTRRAVEGTGGGPTGAGPTTGTGGTGGAAGTDTGGAGAADTDAGSAAPTGNGDDDRGEKSDFEFEG